MASALTGDYDAVVQVSGGTVNRVLAALHQNAFVDAKKPSFPHVVSIRIGDPSPIRGHRGWVQAQVGAPRVELIHRSTDRFHLEVGVRARYRGDAGSRPLPEFINGIVRAQFRVEDIDPNCLGWRNRAEDHVWVRVVRGTVSFDGTAVDDAGLSTIQVIDDTDPAEVNALISRLIEHLLMTRFEANPHRVGRDFRRTWLRSLVAGGESAVAVPVAFDEPPVGRLSSLDEVFLGGRDVAAAVSTEAIVRRINAELAERLGFLSRIRLKHTSTALGVDVLNVDITWNVYLTSAWVEWATLAILSLAGGPASVMTLHLAGKADTGDDDYDLDFTATQTLAMYLDVSSQSLIVQPVGSPSVSVDAHMGWPVEGLVESHGPGLVAPYLKNVIPASSIPVSGATQALADQLDKLAAGASVRFDAADFGIEEVVLRGTVAMPARSHPTVSFVKTPEGDGFSALEAWIPGGIVDRFEWTWSFPEGTTGNANRQDRWLLRRPAAKQQGRFNSTFGGRSPLPGLDGSGRLCLTIKGRRVDPVSGALVPVTSHTSCKGYGIWFATTVTEETGRPGLRDVPELATDVPFPQLAIRDALLPAGTAGSNTLVVFAGDDFAEDTSTVLLEGLAQVKRSDAGLAVLILFSDGSLTSERSQRVASALAPKLRRLGAALTVNEDVGGSWSATLGADLRDAPAWRLLSPRGGTTWTHDGAADAEQLAFGVGECLLPSGAPIIAEADPWVEAITTVDIYDAAFGDFLDVRSKCPPFPLRDALESGVTVAFVRAGSAASEAVLGTLGDGISDNELPADRPATTMVVVDGGDQDAADAIARQVGPDVAVLADPDGRIGARLGVRIWPTTVRIPGQRRELSIVRTAPPRVDGVSTEAT